MPSKAGPPRSALAIEEARRLLKEKQSVVVGLVEDSSKQLSSALLLIGHADPRALGMARHALDQAGVLIVKALRVLPNPNPDFATVQELVATAYGMPPDIAAKRLDAWVDSYVAARARRRR